MMKNIIFFTALFLLLQSCKKNHSDPPAPTDLGKPYSLSPVPQATSSCDHLNSGMYKAVCINAQDSAASFQINLANDGKQVYTLQFMNGVLRDSLIRFVVDSTTMLVKNPKKQDTSAIKPGTHFYTVFSSFNAVTGNAFIEFGVNGDGSSPVMTTNLSGNQTLNVVLKEKSDKQVLCYEGAYLGGYLNPNSNAQDSGRIALVATADTAILIVASKAFPQFFPASGAAVKNNQSSIEVVDGPGGANFVFSITISGNTCSGTWTRKNSNASGTFSANRTL